MVILVPHNTHYKKSCILPENYARSMNPWEICQEQCQGDSWEIANRIKTISQGQPLTKTPDKLKVGKSNFELSVKAGAY